MRSFRIAIFLGVVGLLTGVAFADHHEADHHEADHQGLPRNDAPEGASVYFISPENGDTISGPVTVVFGLRGMGVAPAGVQQPNTGHHHLIIDAPTPDPNAPIPNDDHHRHFGGGQTQVTLELGPGNHTLQLVLGDFNHIPHTNPVESKRISIRVKSELQ